MEWIPLWFPRECRFFFCAVVDCDCSLFWFPILMGWTPPTQLSLSELDEFIYMISGCFVPDISVMSLSKLALAIYLSPFPTLLQPVTLIQAFWYIFYTSCCVHDTNFNVHISLHSVLANYSCTLFVCI